MVLFQWTLIALTGAFAFLTVQAAVEWNVADAGFITSGDFSRVVVEPGSAAERAGLRGGDVVDWLAMPVHDRYIMSGQNYAGEALTVVVRRDGIDHRVSFRLEATKSTLDRLLTTYVTAAGAVFVLALAAFVLARRPSIDAVAVWMIVSGFANLANVAEYTTGNTAMAVWVVASTALAFLPFTGGLLLAVRALPASQKRRNVELGLAAGWSAFIAFCAVENVRQVFLGLTPPAFVQWLFADNIVTIVTLCLLAAIVATGFVRARGAARVRLQWFAAGIGALAIAVAMGMIGVLIPQAAFSSGLIVCIAIASDAGILLIVYPILREDVFGVGFVVNRAAMYAIVTGIVVGVFAGVNWLIGLALKSTGLALPVDVLLAAGAGLSLNLVQRRINRVVDRVLFRKRYEAAQRLRRVARALTHAKDVQTIAEAIVVEPCEALDLHAAAYFARAEDGSFARVAVHGWPPGAATVIGENDRFVLHLLGNDDVPVRMDDIPHAGDLPHGAPRPRIALPLWSRRELVGFAFFSAHRSGATLDPEEVESIERITSAATAAFDRVAAAQLRHTQEELVAVRAENARLVALMERATA